jgi:DNA-nicking Smr family endonuclease
MASKKSPHDPLANSPFKKGLKPLKEALVAEEAARVASARAPKTAKMPDVARPRVPIEVWRPDMDQRLFDVAMSGVEPLRARRAQRVSGSEHTPLPKAPRDAKAKQVHAAGAPAVTVTWQSDGTVRGARRGREFALVALERFATPDDALDLHGEEPSSVKLRVDEFVRTRRARGLRCVSVITGYGKRSPDGTSVLLDAAVAALREAPAASDLDAFMSAPDAHGGRGALLISLRA